MLACYWCGSTAKKACLSLIIACDFLFSFLPQVPWYKHNCSLLPSFKIQCKCMKVCSFLIHMFVIFSSSSQVYDTADGFFSRFDRCLTSRYAVLLVVHHCSGQPMAPTPFIWPVLWTEACRRSLNLNFGCSLSPSATHQNCLLFVVEDECHLLDNLTLSLKEVNRRVHVMVSCHVDGCRMDAEVTQALAGAICTVLAN